MIAMRLSFWAYWQRCAMAKRKAREILDRYKRTRQLIFSREDRLFLVALLRQVRDDETQKTKDQKTDELHEISCCYSGGPEVPYYQTIMMCSCGFSTTRCACWADAGYEMDSHIEKINS